MNTSLRFTSYVDCTYTNYTGGELYSVGVGKNHVILVSLSPLDELCGLPRGERHNCVFRDLSSPCWMAINHW